MSFLFVFLSNYSDLMLPVFVPSKLEKITNYHIVVDQIQTHENAQGKPEADK